MFAGIACGKHELHGCRKLPVGNINCTVAGIICGKYELHGCRDYLRETLEAQMHGLPEKSIDRTAAVEIEKF